MSSAAFLAPLFAAVGLALGSFANVLIVRYGTKRWVAGRSMCPRCKKPLQWRDLVPVLSYVLLGGRCRHCRKPISARYPLVELASAALFLLALHRVPDQPVLALLSGGVLYMLLVTSAVDAEHREIPDIFSIVIAVLGLVSAVFYGSFLDALFGAVLGVAWFGWQWLVSRCRWVGSGDMLLAGALGLWLGFLPTVAMLVAAYASGAAVAGGLVLSRGPRSVRNMRIPFAPFIALGTLAAFLGAADWYLSFF
jgi:leader peptidase (prepilin peptidase) / N-methyltransferase